MKLFEFVFYCILILILGLLTASLNEEKPESKPETPIICNYDCSDSTGKTFAQIECKPNAAKNPSGEIIDCMHMCQPIVFKSIICQPKIQFISSNQPNEKTSL